MTTKKTAIKASVKYCETKGYDVLDTEWEAKNGDVIDIVAKDNDRDALVFIEVKHSTKSLSSDKVSDAKRKKLEVCAALYLKEHDYVDMSVRFDMMGLLIVDKSKALMRHHVNALGESNA